MEELSAVGEQVFDAECILNKRLRKVGAAGRERFTSARGFCSVSFWCFFNGFVLFFLISFSPAARAPQSDDGDLKENPLSFCWFPFLSGKVGVPGEVEGMVIQVSASGAAAAQTMKTTTACRLLRFCSELRAARSFFQQFLLRQTAPCCVFVCTFIAQRNLPLFYFSCLLLFTTPIL